MDRGITITNKYEIICVCILFFSTVACSPSKQSLALKRYDEAMIKGDIDPVIATLKHLSFLDKNTYQNKLIKAQTAGIQYSTAKAKFNSHEYVAAYLSSHIAYRALPIAQTKVLLVASGQVLHPLLKAYLKTEKAFELSPKQINKQLKTYSKQQLIDWNLIEVNQFLKEMSYSIKLLQQSTMIIKNIYLLDKNPQLLNWQLSIEKQSVSLNQAKESIINITLATSASKLLTLNKQLVESSVEMLSLLRPSISKSNLQPLFFKAQISYQNYQILNENISLASNISQQNSHSVWYEKWHKIENSTLIMGADIEKYPLNSPTRIQQLKHYKMKYHQTHLLPIFNYNNMKELMANQQEIQQLINTLSIDKTLISYGNSKYFMDKI